MSPPPCRFRQVEVLPPGMKSCTAPTVHPAGQATLAPVVGSTQCAAFARSPYGGVPGAGSALGMPAPIGIPSPSGGGAPLVSSAPPGFSDQPLSTPPFTDIPKPPLLANCAA